MTEQEPEDERMMTMPNSVTPTLGEIIVLCVIVFGFLYVMVIA